MPLTDAQIRNTAPGERPLKLFDGKGLSCFQGKAKLASHYKCLQRFLTLFGPSRIQALLADREFVGQAWFA